MRKRIISFILVMLLCAVNVSTGFVDTPMTVQAHSGRTDASGGHKDNKNKSGLGYYHYHCGGYPAHLHENGVCPYAVSSTETTGKAATQTTTSKAADSQVSPSSEIAAGGNTINYESVIFNAAFYAAANPDIAQAVGTDTVALYNHFISAGMAEGRQGAATFNVQVYMANNQDLVALFGDNLPAYYNHYLTQGQLEGRIACIPA